MNVDLPKAVDPPMDIDGSSPPPPPDEEVVFLSDEGAGLIEAASLMGWKHFHDQHHLTDKIVLCWGGLADPIKFKNDVHRILNTVDKAEVSLLLDTALSEYTSSKAQALLQKISEKREMFCFAYSCHHYTAGHVGDTRSEGRMSDIKGKGKLSTTLAQSNFEEAVCRIMSVQRNMNLKAREELVKCRQDGQRVGTKYLQDLKSSKAAATNFAHVVPCPGSDSKYMVKEKASSPSCCIVDLQGTVKWNGGVYSCLTGTCAYFTSTRKICPCAIAAVQRLEGVDIDDPKWVHPSKLIWHHPLYQEALLVANLPDYSDSPYTSAATNIKQIDPIASSATESSSDIINRLNGEMLEKMGTMSTTTPPQRIMKIRQLSSKLEKVACLSASNFKAAAAGVISITNRLQDVKIGRANVVISTSAVQNTLGRSLSNMIENRSPLAWNSKQNVSTSAVKSNGKAARHCTHCRDVHDQPSQVSKGHRCGSTKCPTKDWPLPEDKKKKALKKRNGGENGASAAKKTKLDIDVDGLEFVGSTLPTLHTGSGDDDNDILTKAVVHEDNHAAQLILDRKGTRHHMKGDGSCGYWSVRWIGVGLGVLPSTITITALRKNIKEYAILNETKFIGSTELGEDTVFKSVDGQIGYAYGQRKKHDPQGTRHKTFHQKILNGIYSDGMDYNSSVTPAHYMNASNVLPIIVHMLKIPSLLLYTSVQANNTIPSAKGKKVFFSDLYTYNVSNDTVYYKQELGLMDVPEGVNHVMVFYDDMVHFEGWSPK